MSKKISTLTTKMVASKTKNKVLTCSTPEHRSDSPSRDSDSLCDSETASPVPFLCTQDGADGETDVVWNFYTPKADNAPTSRIKNTTPLSRKAKRSMNPRLIDKPITKRKVVKPSQKKTELFQDLLELNQNLHQLIKKSDYVIEKPQSGSEDDIFNDSRESSPKSGLRTNSRCLRRNVLSSKFSRQDTEAALESDDSMNECLIKASQVVEEKIFNQPTPAKRVCYESSKTIKNFKPGINLDNDSMDAILNSIKLDSPLICKTKCDSPKLNNDSFDSFVGNLNDSALERLTQMPIKNNANKSKLNNSNMWTVQDITLNDGSPSNKSIFARHNSMPESPSVADNRPSTSGMAFGRYNSMPHKNNGDSPIKCTPDEIKRKHQQAREKLLAKRLLPFTSTQQSSQQLLPATQTIIVQKKNQFQPRVPSTSINKPPTTLINTSSKNHDTTNIKLIIEKKRQEALMKLRRRQPQNKS